MGQIEKDDSLRFASAVGFGARAQAQKIKGTISSSADSSSALDDPPSRSLRPRWVGGCPRRLWCAVVPPARLLRPPMAECQWLVAGGYTKCGHAAHICA